MGDFWYEGAHSLDIYLPKKVEGELVYDDVTPINTWEKWKIAPAARPFVASPPIKEEYVDVPGADGMLDYTDVLTGSVRYGNRTGSWQFLVENGNFEWYKLQSEILSTLHGKKCRVVLTDEPEYYYEGRITVGTAFGNKDYAGIIFNYNFGPFKYRVGSEDTKWWKWNSLFLNTIEYGPFQVNGVKSRNFINNNEHDVVASIEATNNMVMVPYDGSEEEQYHMFVNNFDKNLNNYQHVDIGSGETEYVLSPGNNYIFFIGKGNVTVTYARGKTL